MNTKKFRAKSIRPPMIGILFTIGLIKPFIAFIPVRSVLAPLLPRTPVTPLLAIFVAAERRTDFGIRSKFFVPNLSINLSLPNLLKYLFITEGDTFPFLSNPFLKP